MSRLAGLRLPEGPSASILIYLGALMMFAVTDGFAKYLASHMDAVEVTWSRYAFYTLSLLPVVLWRAKRGRLLPRRPRLQLVRGTLMLACTLLSTFAIAVIPLAEFTTIGFVGPMFVTALSVLILKEPVGIRRWSAVLVGFLGIMIVTRPGTTAFNPAVLLIVASSACWALGFIATRILGAVDDPTTTMIYTTLVGLVLTSAMVGFVWRMPTPFEWLIMVLNGCGNLVGQWLQVLAISRVHSSLLAPFGYTHLVFTGTVGYIAFDALPDGWTLAGAAVIVASGIYVWHRERVRQVPPSAIDPAQAPRPRE